jgi:putative chitinase
MAAITEARMREFAPHAHTDIVKALLLYNADDILISGGIVSALILSHFMAQCYVETAGFSTLTENLHYTAARLRQEWPKKFLTLAQAQTVAGDPVKTADEVYGGRMGNNRLGDGYKYRGGGLLDMTGKNNYTNATKKTGIDLVGNPDLARDPTTALRVAVSVWKALGCNEPASRDNGEEVTQLVNGGQNGASERALATDKASAIFLDDPVPSHTAVGFLSSPSDDADQIAAPPLPAAPVPMTTLQAKQLQQQLKDKSYSPGEIDGNILGPSTVGSIAELQKQQGLPVTGVVDDATEDAIQDAPPKVVSLDRAMETAASLRAKGSDTIRAADASKGSANGVLATGVSLVAVSGGSIISSINDQADAIKQVTDHVPGLSDKLSDFITMHWQLFVLIVFGGILLYLAKTLHTSANKVISERVRKSASGEDMSH